MSTCPISTSHEPVAMSLLPLKIILALQVTCTSLFMNFSSTPSSQAADVYNSDLVIVESAQYIRTLVCSDGMLRMPQVAAFIVLSSCSSTVSLLLI